VCSDVRRFKLGGITDGVGVFLDQISILKTEIKVLSDTNDALTKRLNDVEVKIKKHDQPK
jgi:hypothetical protein